MSYAYNELSVLFKKAGLTDESQFELYLDVYHTNPDKTPESEQVWSVGTVIKNAYNMKQKLEEYGLKVVKLPKAKVIRVKIPCRSMFTYIMNIGRLYILLLILNCYRFDSMDKYLTSNGLKWKSAPIAYSKIGGNEFGVLEYDVDEGWLFDTAVKN